MNDEYRLNRHHAVEVENGANGVHSTATSVANERCF
jgi:hypothetical protein